MKNDYNSALVLVNNLKLLEHQTQNLYNSHHIQADKLLQLLEHRLKKCIDSSVRLEYKVNL